MGERRGRQVAEAAFLVLVVLLGIAHVHANGTYTVVAPQRVRAFSSYHVALTTQNVEQPTTITVEVSGRQESGGNRSFVESAVVQPHVTNNVKLEIGDLSPGTYNLTVRGVGGLEFTNTTELFYDEKSFSVFIITDKGIYKPGQTVRLRILLLDRYMKPSLNHSMDVHISDGKQNRVKQWQRVKMNVGVFTTDLPLSDSPVLGTWTIAANVLNQTFSKTFDVAEYVLPTFEVSAEGVGFATVREHKLTILVDPKYTYGKPVRGEATIIVRPTYQWPPTTNNTVQKTVPINGKSTVDIDVQDIKLEGSYDHYLEVIVIVEEAFTQRSQNTTTHVTLHHDEYTLEQVWNSAPFKPGEKYLASIKVKNLDGSPVQDKENLVTIRYGFSYDIDNYTSVIQRPIQDDGIVEVELMSPSNTTMIGIQAQYKDVKQFLGALYAPPPTPQQIPLPPETPTTALSAKFITENAKVNEYAEVEIAITTPLTHLSYIVVSRGDIVAANTTALTELPKRDPLRIRFQITPAMTPSMQFLVYAIDRSGVVIADSRSLEVKGALQNFANITVAPSRAEPGQDVKVQVQSEPNSFVGLLGVDQSVLLKQPSNDISMMNVESEIRRYESPSYYFYRNHRWRRRRSFIMPFGYHSDTLLAFSTSGTVLMSNGKLNFTSYGNVYPESFGVRPVMASAAGGVSLDSAVYAMAVPAAPGSGLRGVVSPPRIRKNFPETWIWDGVHTGADGKGELKLVAPDTITSWVITGFSLDPVHGLGLSSERTNLTVFRPFFVSVDLPYSVIRGEVLALPVVVFNYMDEKLTTEVTMDKTDDFDFAEDLNEVDKPGKQQRRKRLTIPSQSSDSVSFLITPKNLGDIPIKVTAIGNQASDAVERKLLVKAEGDTQYKNKAFLVDLRNSSSYSTRVKLDIPEDIVKDSEKIEVSAIGDILGPSTENLDNLIKMPYGCGEQNMLNFVPNIVALDYLKNTRKRRASTESKARKYMEAGYQRELSYRHEDGSFSAFGSNDPSGSTWLTAFVAKSFLQAKAHINIEDRIVDEALRWLAAHQAANGSFPEVGKVSHSAMQGGAAHGLALTAYVLTTFLQHVLTTQQHNQTLTSEYRETIDKGFEYIIKNMENLNDPYVLAITTYALHLDQHPAKEGAFKILESKANLKGDSKWWNKTITKDEQQNPWYGEPNSLDVEMTSYALLTYMQRPTTRIEDAVPIMNWLISQRNANGGFASTQDTVIGLQALAALAERISAEPGEAKVTLTYPPEGGKDASIDVKKDEAFVLHKREIPRDVRDIAISAVGSGVTLVQVSYSYNVDSAGAYPLFTLKPQVDKSSNADHLKLSICSAFIPGSHGSESNMAVMEVTLPSGFTADREIVSKLLGSEGVSRVETKDADSVVVLYFDKITREEFCPTVSAYRTHKVAMLKPSPVTVYDYYDQSRRAREFYQPAANTTLCDICEGGDCKKKCSEQSTNVIQAPAAQSNVR